MPDYYPLTTKDTWHDPIVMIDDSDTPDAVDFNPSTENVADNLAYLYKRLILGGAGGCTQSESWQVDGTLRIGGSMLVSGDAITSIAVVTGGTGYNAATTTVSISAPQLTAFARQATAHATIVGGVVTGVVIDDGGEGYIPFSAFIVGSGVTVTITDTGGGSGATASANITATVTYANGTTVTYANGSALVLAQFATATIGGQMAFSSTSTATGTWTWSNGAILAFNATMNIGPTGSVNACSASPASPGWLLTNGNGIAINDGTSPTFVTPRQRSIAQPFLFPAISGAWAAGGSTSAASIVADTANGVCDCSLTKLVNGAKLYSVTFKATWPSGHTAPTLHGASATLHQVDLSGNDTTIGSASLVTTSNAAAGGTPFTIYATGTPTIDDTQYTYYVQFEGEYGTNAQQITFYAMQVQIQNITTLGPN